MSDADSHEKEFLVHGRERLQSNVVPNQRSPVPEPRFSVVLPDGGQDGEVFNACLTRSGRDLLRNVRDWTYDYD